MKRLSRLFTVGFMLVVAFTQTLLVKASPSQDLTLTATEIFVKTELMNNGSADLTNLSDRTIRGEFVSGLLKDPDLQGKPSITITGAIVADDIKVAGLNLPFIVELQNCTFNGGIDLESTETKTFRIDNSTVTGPVKMGRMIVNGDLALYQSTFKGEVTLFGADISKNLFARGSKFLALTPDPNSAYPFELWTTHIGQTAEFTGVIIQGEAKVDNAKFDADVKFDGATFEKPASFMNITVGNVANFQKAVFKDTVTFESSIIDRDIQFSGAAFAGNANFDYLSVTRFFDFDQTTLEKDFSFQYPTIGWPYFESAVFNGPVNFEGMQASNDFDFSNASYTYSAAPFKVYLAKVNGRASFSGFTAPAGLELSHNQFGSLDISGNEKQKFAFIHLDSTKVDSDLNVENITTDEFSAQGFVATGSTTFRQMKVEKNLDISNASLGVFTVGEEFWLQKSDAFNLRGMTYSDIGLVNQELNDDTWGVLLRMVQQSSYSPQTYRTLEQFLTDKGHPEWAAQVELNRKIRERDEILWEHNTGAWLWSWFLYLFSGYGQIPALALVWSALVIAIGGIMYWKESDLVILAHGDTKPVYNPFLYSFALFVPFIELDIAEKWDPKPDRRVAWIYKYIHKILGWILTPIALLTFGGIIK
ncbi:MAG: pentapeptide repeat-containing protein [Chloroflexota bacterium]